MNPRPHPAEAPRRVRREELVCAALACALYLPALAYEFVRDDRELLLEGSLLRAPGTLGRLLLSDYWSPAAGESGLWRPFVTLTLWLDGSLTGWSPAWFHAANALTHGLATFLLVRVVAACGGGATAMWVAGLWFAVMPAHVESVAWVAGRTDLWCAVFALAALMMARGSAAARRAGPGAFALALLSKESALAMAPVLALVPVLAGDDAPAASTRLPAPPADRKAPPSRRMGEGFRPGAAVPAVPAPPAASSAAHGARQRAWSKAWRAALPTALVVAAWAAVHALLVRPLAASAGLESFAARLWTALAVPAWELRFLLPGVGHGPDWMLSPLASPAPAAFLGAALHLLAGWLLVRLVRRRDPLALPLGILWLPLLGLSALALLRGALFSGERHIYLASAGAAWLAGGCLERAMKPRARTGVIARSGFVALAGALIAWSAGDALAALPAWRNEEAMYAAMERTQPRNATGPLGQALAAIDHGDDARAWEALARAAAIDSTRYEIALYRAGILLRRGRPEEAIALAREAGARVGWNRDARLIEALALQRLGRWAEARPVLEDLRARTSGDADVSAALGAQRAGESRAPDSAGASPRRE